MIKGVVSNLIQNAIKGYYCVFNAYRSKLLEKANTWLKDNTDVRVRNCETITWMSHDMQQLGNSEQMVLTKQLAEGKNTYYARGLRYLLLLNTYFVFISQFTFVSIYL